MRCLFIRRNRRGFRRRMRALLGYPQRNDGSNERRNLTIDMDMAPAAVLPPVRLNGFQ